MILDPQVFRLRSETGVSNLLVFKEGRTLVHAVTIDKRVRIVTLPKVEQRYMKPLELRGKPYPVARACRRLLSAGKTLGISAKARAVLNEIKKEAS